MSIEELIAGSKILLIPVVSMRSYDSGRYNLMADGNISRIVSKLAISDFDEATILIPKKVDGIKELNNLLMKVTNGKKINFLFCSGYGKNAGETRESILNFCEYFETENIKFESYDRILIEPNNLTLYLINEYKYDKNILDKMIYWCPVSTTVGFTPNFIKKFALIDKEIASYIKVAAATKSQVEYLGGLSFVDKSFYEPKVFDYKTIFFPFRLSDPCYHSEEFKMIVDSLKDKYNFKVLYTDPNDSGLFDDNDIFVKVPSQKEVYIQILKSKPIIPYFENSNDVLHISIHEFAYYGCDVIMFKNDSIHFDTGHEVNNIQEAAKEIEKLLM